VSFHNSVLFDVSSVPEQPTGAGRYIIELTKAFNKLEAKSVIILARKGDHRFNDFAPNLKTFELAPKNAITRLTYEKFLISLASKKLQCSIIHSPHYTVPIGSKKNLVVTIHDLTFVKHPEWHTVSKRIFFTHELKKAAKTAGAIICVSDSTLKAFEQIYGVRDNVFVIPHGINLEIFNLNSGDDSKLLGDLGVTEPYLLFVGTIEPRKNIARLIQAVKRLKDLEVLEEKVTLVLVGKKGWKVSLDQTYSWIKPVGFVQDKILASLYRRSLCVVYPALEEGFGLPVVEALACGAKVVTSACSPMAALAKDLAINCDPYSVESIANAIKLACLNTDASYKERAAKLAYNHSWEKSALDHIMVYDKLLGSK
jgi:glycosyltransferase involved in cell wall biosynthesis